MKIILNHNLKNNTFILGPLDVTGAPLVDGTGAAAAVFKGFGTALLKVPFEAETFGDGLLFRSYL